MSVSLAPEKNKQSKFFGRYIKYNFITFVLGTLEKRIASSCFLISPEFRLPERVLPAYYLADDFEDLTEDDVDEDDTACLLALQDVEQRTMAELQQ